MEPPTELAPATLGLIAQRYELEALLGTGGMGSVYRAHDREVGEDVALKLMRTAQQASPSPKQIERFRREVRLARRVTHPNAARVYDIGHEEERWYLTMELVVGESLAERLERETQLDLAPACRIGADICAGLGAIHAAGIVHRDLKPANVLIASPTAQEPAERVIVTDFGIAKALDLGDGALTRGVIGTPGYMAPEQALGTHAVDARTDIFALGTILYRMLCGHHPTDAQVPGEDGRPAPWPPPLRPGLPPALNTLIERCLAPRLHLRPDNCKAIEVLLRGLAEGHTSPATTLRAPLPRSTAPLSLGPDKTKRMLSVLPLRQRGGHDEDLGATISEELIDLLSRCRGLWVSSFSATEGYADKRDPKLLARELGSDYVVDGTVQQRGSRLRVAVRLIDASSGVQLWSETVSGELEDVFELQDRLALTISEHLRAELTLQGQPLELPPEALTLYMCARESLRSGALRHAHELLGQALELEPGFEAAAALRANTALRAWFLYSHEPEQNWMQRAHEAIIVARAVAPSLSNTHQACGVFALHTGAFDQAVFSFQHALAIAPTNPLPTHYLGMLDVEVGQFERGRRRLELAHSLMPNFHLALAELARLAALVEDHEAYAHWMAKLEHVPSGGLAFSLTRMRVAIWRRDHATIATHWEAAELVARGADQVLHLPRMLARPSEYAALMPQARERAAKLDNHRFQALIYQCLIEVACFHDHIDEAAQLLELALAAHFIDLAWLERCPVLESLRAHPSYGSQHQRLQLRALSLHSGTTNEARTPTMQAPTRPGS